MTHASVFSGIGGPEVAATMLGWTNLFHCEINPFGRAVLDYWYPNAKSYDDITKTDFTEWRGRVDVLTGGFPCQPFSYAGQRRGAEDDRYLWPYMFKCIDAIRPTWVVAENVGGILTMVEQGEVSEVGVQGSLFGEEDVVRGYELRETFTLERICDDLETHGYAVQPVLVPACAVGAPHRRDRVFVVGRRRDGFVADPDNGADGRAAGADEGESREERLQKRHEVREPDEPNQVRREGAVACQAGYAEQTEGGRPAANAEGDGDSGRPRQVCGAERRPTELNAEPCINGEIPTPADTDNAAYADSTRAGDNDSQTGDEGRRASKDWGESIRQRNWSFGASWVEPTSDDAENALCDGLQWGHTEEQEHQRNERNIGAGNKQRICDKGARFGGSRIAGCGRWDNFPTVSPVHRGNDGLPFDVDNLTIPFVRWHPREIFLRRANFSKWRTESLKAYGNAIVPAVMYEIFRAIEIVETEYRKGTTAK